MTRTRTSRRVRRKEADGFRTVMTLSEPRRCGCGRTMTMWLYELGEPHCCYACAVSAGIVNRAMIDVNEPMRVRQCDW